MTVPIYAPQILAYSGSAAYPGIPVWYPGEFPAASAMCSDIINATETVGPYYGYYMVDCDFVTLSGSGTVFFADPGDMQVKIGILVNSENPGKTGFLSYDNLTDIVGIETGFICSAILLFGLIRQFRKINSVLW